jgi:hypothetical protein
MGRTFVGTRKEPNISIASFFLTTQGATFLSLEEAAEEIRLLLACHGSSRRSLGICISEPALGLAVQGVL